MASAGQPGDAARSTSSAARAPVGAGSKTTNESLMACAVQAADKAYCPYSKFRVGAALETADGSIYTGCNVENASYGLTICAERTALVKMVSDGHTQIKSIAVACVSLPDDGISSPCGACRQFMAEFGQFPVLLRKGDGIVESSVDELLPYAFRPESFPSSTAAP
eukprot:m.64310 g.64310  ORF g.64310 m.64310 type:complete len:165 (+) comp9710_c0_seq3:157-651(+)